MKINVEVNGLQDAVRALQRIASALEILCIPTNTQTDSDKPEPTPEPEPTPKDEPEVTPVYTGKKWIKGRSVSHMYTTYRSQGLSVALIGEAIKATKARNWNKAASDTFAKYLSCQDARRVLEYCKEKGYIKKI